MVFEAFRLRIYHVSGCFELCEVSRLRGPLGPRQHGGPMARQEEIASRKRAQKLIMAYVHLFSHINRGVYLGKVHC